MTQPGTSLVQGLQQTQDKLALLKAAVDPGFSAQIDAVQRQIAQLLISAQGQALNGGTTADRIRILFAQLADLQRQSRLANPNLPVLTTTDTQTETLFLRVDGTAVSGDSFSDRRTQMWLSELQTQRNWAALLAAPIGSATDLLSIEVSGPVYRRPELSFRFANPRLLVTDLFVEFLGLPEGVTAYGLAVMDAPYNGNVEAVMPLPEPRPFPLGGEYVIPAGELFLGFA